MLEALGDLGDFIGGIAVVATLIYLAYFDWFVSLVATPGRTSWWETVGRPIYFDRMVRAVETRLAKGDFHDVRALDMFMIDD